MVIKSCRRVDVWYGKEIRKDWFLINKLYLVCAGEKHEAISIIMEIEENERLETYTLDGWKSEFDITLIATKLARLYYKKRSKK